jgi:glycerol kinase
VAETWEPAMNTGHRDTLARSWSKAVERSMGWT